MTGQNQSVETLIIGAGVIGSSVAMHLARLGAERVRVLDFDLEGGLSSSELNAGGVRATWIQPINIQMSKLSIDYFASIADEVGYRACGYLWLHPASRLEQAIKARERQVAFGWEVDVLDLPALRRKFSLIDKTDGIAGAVFAPRDGLVNPNLLKNHFRTEARKHGVIFEDAVWVKEVKYEENSSLPVRVIAEKFEKPLSGDEKKNFLTKKSSSAGARVEYRAENIVNCAGPWASRLAAILNYPCESFPVRRQVSIFDCRDADLTQYGMIVDTSGVYFHPEATNGLAGFAAHEETPGFNFEYDGEKFFEELIWPALYERSSAFEKLRHLTGWAGLYEVSPDETAVLGKVVLGEAGRSGRVFEAHSFSGHGVMHSYAAGLALAEQIMRKKALTLDTAELSGDRFSKGRMIRETLVI